jgi:hypothetical protein
LFFHKKIKGEMMKDRGKGLEQPLAKLEDKEEWKVRIYVDLERMKDWISKTNPGTREEELVQDELNKKLNEYKQKSFGWISKQAEEAKLNEIACKESNQKKKALVLNSTYLVSKEKREDFTKVVRFLEEDYKEKGLEFKYIGPRPPHSFSSAK